jgi:uncharacterized protein
MIFKFIILAVIIYIIYLTFFKKESVVARKEHKPRAKKEEDSEIMVECVKCGVFISSKEAIIKDGKYYCSKECAELK